MKKVLSMIVFLCGLILFADAAKATVQFLPASSNGSGYIATNNKSDCRGFSTIQKSGSGWDCATCEHNGVTKYKCRKKMCPSGYSAATRKCGKGKTLEVGGYSGNRVCGRCN